MRKSRALCLLLLVGLLVGPFVFPHGFFSASAQTLQPSKAASSLYIIQPNDILEIFVWKQPELSRKVTVRPDGRISLPTVQDLQAAGLNPTELKVKLEDALKDIVDVPNVTVIVEAIRSYRIFVGGKVAMQGAIAAETPLSLAQALVLASGPGPYAKETEVVLLRGSGEDTDRRTINFKDVIEGRNPSANILLKSGDVIYVQ